MLTIKIVDTNSQLFVTVIYKPPSVNNNEFLEDMDKLLQHYGNKEHGDSREYVCMYIYMNVYGF